MPHVTTHFAMYMMTVCNFTSNFNSSMLAHVDECDYTREWSNDDDLQVMLTMRWRRRSEGKRSHMGRAVTCRAGSVMPLGGSWVVANMIPVTNKLGRATITNGHRQLVTGPANKSSIDWVSSHKQGTMHIA